MTTITSTCQPARPRHASSLRVDLARRTINAKLHADRVSKPASSKKPAKLSPRQNDAMVRWLRARTRSLNLNPDELICAQAIFDKLPTIPRVASRSPRLYYRSSGKYELVDPGYGIWKFKGLSLDVYGLDRHPRNLCLSPERIHTLLNNLLFVINKLYDAHIAYTPDIKTLRVAERHNDESLWPFVDTFDFSKRVDDQTVPWEDLKNKTIKVIKGQFQIIEQLAELRDPQQLPSFLKFQPDRVAEVFAWHYVDLPQRYFIMRQVNQYSLKFGEVTYDQAQRVVCSLDLRSGPAREYDNKRVRDCLRIVSYVLGLLNRCPKDEQIKHDNLVTQACLWMVYTALLIHLHAKNVSITTQGLLRFQNLVPDAYTSHEGFQSVVNAYSRVRDAIRPLEEQGDHITKWHFFYRIDYGINESNCQELLAMEQCCIEKTGIVPQQLARDFMRYREERRKKSSNIQKRGQLGGC
ncbi:hypothetical protein F4679DRAFT_540596 [Xylaria curta]|nr:hypothetical protein F4679DRAFT_540596 [Xylaria curta]